MASEAPIPLDTYRAARKRILGASATAANPEDVATVLCYELGEAHQATPSILTSLIAEVRALRAQLITLERKIGTNQ